MTSSSRLLPLLILAAALALLAAGLVHSWMPDADQALSDRLERKIRETNRRSRARHEAAVAVIDGRMSFDDAVALYSALNAETPNLRPVFLDDLKPTSAERTPRFQVLSWLALRLHNEPERADEALTRLPPDAAEELTEMLKRRAR